MCRPSTRRGERTSAAAPRHRSNTSYVDTLVDGSWARLDFVSAIRLAYPGFKRTVGAGGLRNDSIVFDREDRAYDPLVIELRDGSTRNVLLVSLDHCRTWKVYPLPAGTFTVEHWVGHNEIDGPPFLAVWRKSGEPDVPGSQVNTLWVTQPQLQDGHLAIPPLVHVTDRCLGLSRDSGGASFAATSGDKTWFVWSEVDSPGPGRHDRTTSPRTITRPARSAHRSFSRSRPPRATPTTSRASVWTARATCTSSAGGHGTPALYLRSLAPPQRRPGLDPAGARAQHRLGHGIRPERAGGQTDLSRLRLRQP